MERFVNLRFPLAVALSVCLGIATAYFFTFSQSFKNFLTNFAHFPPPKLIIYAKFDEKS